MKIKSEVLGGHIRITGLNGQQVLSRELRGKESEFDLPGEIAPGVSSIHSKRSGQKRAFCGGEVKEGIININLTGD